MTRSSAFAIPLAVVCTLPGQEATAQVDANRLLRADGKVAAELRARPWDPEHPRETCKVYHHLYAPDGRLLTKGEGGEFEHHRGLFVGWNQVRWHKRTADFWHMTNGARQTFSGAAPPSRLELGPSAQHLQVQWRVDGEHPAMPVHEHRGLEVLEESATHHVLRLRIALRAGPPDTEVVLDGDPQHSGQQLRALQQFAEKDAEPVRYLRPEGAEPHDNDVWTGCDWIAAVLPLADGPVTVLRVESPHNPGVAIWSTRPYGRFGATRRLTLPARKADVHEESAMPWVGLDFFYVVALGEQDLAWCEGFAQRLRRLPAPWLERARAPEGAHDPVDRDPAHPNRDIPK